MAVLVGLALGTVAGLRRWNVSGGRLVVVPLCFALLEIIVNMTQFGVAAVAVWSVVLVVLAALGTLGARAATLRWAEAHTH